MRARADGLARALALLTIVPLPAAAFAADTGPASSNDARLSGAAVWFPVVGAAVGALAGGVRLALQAPLGGAVATVLAMIVLVIATGALHQDGLADTADGLGARTPADAAGARDAAGGRARRLEVMRDSSTGVFGALALIGWALLLASTLASLDGERALRALIAACALARWAALVHAAAAPPARAAGLGAALHVERIALAVASLLAALVALAACGAGPGAAAIATSALVAALSVLFARRTLGGRTGDTLGATVAVAEVAVCTVLLGVWHG